MPSYHTLARRIGRPQAAAVLPSYLSCPLRERSRVNEKHERFQAFSRRSLYDVNLVMLFLDAIFLPVRPSGPKQSVICAWGIDENGHRALVSVRLGAREAKEDGLELGRDLISRGLARLRLVVADRGRARADQRDRGDLAAR